MPIKYQNTKLNPEPSTTSGGAFPEKNISSRLQFFTGIQDVSSLGTKFLQEANYFSSSRFPYTVFSSSPGWVSESQTLGNSRVLTNCIVSNTKVVTSGTFFLTTTGWSSNFNIQGRLKLNGVVIKTKKLFQWDFGTFGTRFFSKRIMWQEIIDSIPINSTVTWEWNLSATGPYIVRPYFANNTFVAEI